MRDMHDGIGAQLVSMLNALRTRHVDAREIEQQVQESLDQLRLTIDSLEPVEGDLATVLGHLRFRLGKRFEASGILLDWQVEPLPALDYLTPANVAHIQKIVIEAFTNIVKHARASRVRLSARAAADRIEIEIEDDGRGRTGAESGGGRGIENMRFRAQAVGAQFSIGFRSQGTVVALALPLQKPV